MAKPLPADQIPSIGTDRSVTVPPGTGPVSMAWPRMANGPLPLQLSARFGTARLVPCAVQRGMLNAATPPPPASGLIRPCSSGKPAPTAAKSPVTATPPAPAACVADRCDSESQCAVWPPSRCASGTVRLVPADDARKIQLPFKRLADASRVMLLCKAANNGAANVPPLVLSACDKVLITPASGVNPLPENAPSPCMTCPSRSVRRYAVTPRVWALPWGPDTLSAFSAKLAANVPFCRPASPLPVSRAALCAPICAV